MPENQAMNCPHCGYFLGSFDLICIGLRIANRECQSGHGLCNGHGLVCMSCNSTLDLAAHLSPEGVTPVLEAVK